MFVAYGDQDDCTANIVSYSSCIEYMYKHTYTCTYVYIHIHIHMHIHTYTYTLHIANFVITILTGSGRFAKWILRRLPAVPGELVQLTTHVATTNAALLASKGLPSADVQTEMSECAIVIITQCTLHHHH